MPPVSKKQAGLFRAVEHGDVQLPGMTPEKAHEMVSGYSTKDLPERVVRKKKAKPKPIAKPAKKG